MCTASAAQLLFSFFLPNKFFLSVRFRTAFPFLHLHTAQSRCRDLNPGPLPYQGSALPLSYTGIPCFFLQDFNRFAAAEFLLIKTLFRQTDYKGSNKLSIQQQFGTKIVHRFFIYPLFSAVFYPLNLPLQRINACIYSFFK